MGNTSMRMHLNSIYVIVLHCGERLLDRCYSHGTNFIQLPILIISDT